MIKAAREELLKFKRKEIGEYGVSQPALAEASWAKEMADSTLKLGKRIFLGVTGLQEDLTTLRKQAEEQDKEVFRKLNEELYELRKELSVAVEVAVELSDILNTAHSYAKSQGDPVWIDALAQALEKSESMISGIGLSPIKAVGDAFDARLHNCVEVVASASMPKDTVIDVFRRGYRYKGKVHRCADVRVSQ
jgi:molecular chaperone GrpE